MLLEQFISPPAVDDKVVRRKSLNPSDDKKIIDDEIHAFMSTGLYNGLDTKELKVYEKGFKSNFKKFTK